MVSNTKSLCTVLFILSDVNNSPQLIAILQKFRKKKVKFKLIIFGEGGSKLCAALDSLEISYSLCSISSKYRIPLVFVSVLRRTICVHPQAVYASGQFATLVAMVAAFIARVHIRIFTRHHSNLHHYYNMRLGLIADKIANIFATKIISVSKIVEDILVKQEGVPPSKVKIIFNGIALDEFQNKAENFDSANGALSYSADAIRIGVISRLTELKGVAYIAEAFVKCLGVFPNAHLSLVGARADSFYEVSNILSHVPSSSYDFTEFNQDIPSFLNSLNILVHVPIAIDIESFGLVYIEGLAVGVPSIFTLSGILNEIPSVQEYVQLVPYMNSDAIYKAMMNLLTHSMTPKDQCPRELLSQFDIGVMADMYYEEICSDFRPIIYKLNNQKFE